tara:strand:- start:367 stop:1182 length:816 start_codon:yes stop_codon:yes gene_type:complete
MPFFKQFPKIEYDFNRTGAITEMLDIFRSVRPLPDLVDNFSGYRFYEVINGERPDVVSQRIYGTTDFYWTFFIVNDFLHDGYRAWPMSQEDLYAYINKEYEGKVLEIETTTGPDPTTQGQRITIDSIAGKFQLGEQLVGQTSGAQGKLIKKNTDMNQLIVQNVTKAFLGNMHENGGLREEVRGSLSTDVVNTYRVYDYADAPYYYYREDDVDKKPVTSARFIEDAVDDSDLAFQTYRNFEFERNEERSKIRYVSPNFIEQFVDQFEEILNV